MAKMQYRPAGRFVYTTGFHTNKAVLNQVHSPDAVFAAKLVQRAHDVGG